MKVCFYLPYENYPSAILCGYEQLRFLASEGLVELEIVTSSSKVSDYMDADAVFFVRSDGIYEVKLAKLLKGLGKSLFYVLDDDLFNVPSYMPCSSRFSQPDIRENIREMMLTCQFLVTPSKNVAEKYGQLFCSTVIVEEPALNCHKHVPANKCIKIGFAGTVERTHDIDCLLSEPLRIIKEKYKEKISIEFFGVSPSIANELICRCIPRADSYQEYHKTMRELNWDIGLAPMPNSSFCACKHYNKFIEYGAHGIITVGSNCLPYTRIIENGKNGFLCNDSTDDWVKTLSRLIDSKEYSDEIRMRVEQQIAEQFSIETVSHEFWVQIENLSISPRCNCVVVILALFRYYYWRIIGRRLQEHGIKLPLIMIKKLYKLIEQCILKRF